MSRLLASSSTCRLVGLLSWSALHFSQSFHVSASFKVAVEGYTQLDGQLYSLYYQANFENDQSLAFTRSSCAMEGVPQLVVLLASTASYPNHEGGSGASTPPYGLCVEAWENISSNSPDWSCELRFR